MEFPSARALARISLSAKIPPRGAFCPTPVCSVTFDAAED